MTLSAACWPMIYVDGRIKITSSFHHTQTKRTLWSPSNWFYPSNTGKECLIPNTDAILLGKDIGKDIWAGEWKQMRNVGDQQMDRPKDLRTVALVQRTFQLIELLAGYWTLLSLVCWTKSDYTLTLKQRTLNSLGYISTWETRKS